MKCSVSSIVILTCVLASVLASPAWGQDRFIEVTPTSGMWATSAEEDFWVNAVAPADVDGDGDIDLAMIGFHVVYNTSSEDRLVVFLNDGPDGSGHWLFTEDPVPLGDLWAGASDLSWGDLDGDGDDDLALGSEEAMALYRNDGGNLTPVPAALPAYWEDSLYTGAYDLRSISWADIDNDNDLDLLVPSVWNGDTYEYSTVLLRNDGPAGAGGWLFVDMDAAIDATAHAHSAWADVDGDLDLDLFLASVGAFYNDGFVKQFVNDGGSFVGEDLLGIKVNHGLADWGDYDSDGDLDIVVAGNIQEADGSYDTVLRIYRNDGDGYTEDTIPGDWLDIFAATWADYDSDGDVDLLATGNVVDPDLSEIVGWSKVYDNVDNVFVDSGISLPAPLSSVGRGGSFTWFDLDRDGDLDYFVAGAYYVPGGNGLVEARMRLFLNGALASNAPPAAPGSPGAAPDDPVAEPFRREGVPRDFAMGTLGTAGVTFSWDASTDDHTPTPGLTYDLKVRAADATAVEAERLPEPGNVGTMTTWRVEGLPLGEYTWSVRAVDNAFFAGPRAEGRFWIGPAPDGGLETDGGEQATPEDTGGDGCSCRVGRGQGSPAALAFACLVAASALRRTRRRGKKRI